MKKVEIEYESITEVDWVTGASLLIKKSTFNEISGFDKRFFLFYEDIDYVNGLLRKDTRIFSSPARKSFITKVRILIKPLRPETIFIQKFHSFFTTSFIEILRKEFCFVCISLQNTPYNILPPLRKYISESLSCVLVPKSCNIVFLPT